MWRLRNATDRPSDDLDANLILRRQTSRLAYNGSVCPPEVIADLKAEARRLGHQFETRVDADAIC